MSTDFHEARPMIVPSEYPQPALRQRSKRSQKRTSVRKIEVLRVIRAATSAGIPIRTLEVLPNGTIRVSSENVAAQSGDLFDEWEDKL